MLDDFIILLKTFANDFIYSLKNDVELIIFLNKVINEVKSRY